MINRVIFWPIVFLLIIMMAGAVWLFELPTYLAISMVVGSLAIIIASFLKGRREGREWNWPVKITFKKD